MNWTKERPTAPGNYVARKIKPFKMLTLHELFMMRGELFVVTSSLAGAEKLTDSFYDNYEWLGPLPE